MLDAEFKMFDIDITFLIHNKLFRGADDPGLENSIALINKQTV